MRFGRSAARLLVRRLVDGQRIRVLGPWLVARCLVASLVVSSMLLGPTNPAVAATGDPFRFIYDQDGRLVAAVTPTDSARYTYDDVGNITAISRVVATTVSVLEFAPHSGVAGTTVTVYGTGFSATPSQNTVKFNGVTAAVTSSTTTQIVASVPTGAASGTINVTAPGGSSTSSATFSVANSAPTITGFSPAVADATGTVTITGTNFDTTLISDDVTFNTTFATVTAGTSTSLTASVPPLSASGPLVVRTVGGKVVASTDLYIAPSGYTAAQVGPRARATLGQPQTLTFGGDSKIGLLLVDGIVGHRISLILSRTGSTTYDISMRAPDGSTTLSAICCSQTWIEPVSLLLTGTYSVVLDPGTSGSGTVTITAYDVPPDATQAITPTNAGTTAALSTTVPGQNMAFTFTGAVGQRVSFSLAQSSGLAWATTVYNPDGSRLWGDNCCGNTWVETGNLPQAGTYKIFLDPVAALTGTLSITAYDVPPDPTPAITTASASPLPCTTLFRSNMAFTFTGAAGQRLSFSLAQSSGLAWATTVYNPDGSILWGTNCCGNTSALFTTTQSGTHKVLVDPVTTAVGSMTGSVALTGGALPAPMVASLDVPAVATQVYPNGARASLAALDIPRAQALEPQPPAPSFSPPRDPPDWIPGTAARQNWRSGRADSPWRTLPHLRADMGVTALAGQVLALNGAPLAGIPVEIEGITGVTNANGQFLLKGIEVGHQELLVNGGLARDRAAPAYGVYEVGLEIRAGLTNLVPA